MAWLAGRRKEAKEHADFLPGAETPRIGRDRKQLCVLEFGEGVPASPDLRQASPGAPGLQAPEEEGPSALYLADSLGLPLSGLGAALPGGGILQTCPHPPRVEIGE